MMIIGCDFHPSWQQVSWLDTETGETGERKLVQASGDAERFYRQLPAPALIGMEATGNCHWLVDLLAELGHELWVGDAAQIRASCVRQQKTDRRDAEHIRILLQEGRFPHLDAVERSSRSAAAVAASLQAGDDTGAGEERVAASVPESGSAAPAQAVDEDGTAGAA
jgi:transposase